MSIPIRVVAFLPNNLLAHLLAAIGDVHAVRAASRPDEIVGLLRSTDAELLVVDPTIHGGLYIDELEMAIASHRQVPVAVYTTLTPGAMRAVLRFAQLGVRHVLLHGVDDGRAAFLALIDRLPEDAVTERLLEGLAVPLSQLPSDLRRVVEQLLRSSVPVRKASEMAVMAGMTHRSLNRFMTSAGMHPRHVITCARLVRAYALLRVPGSRVKEVSAKLGFAKPQALTELLLLWTGCTSREIGESLRPEVFVQRLLERLHQTTLAETTTTLT